MASIVYVVILTMGINGYIIQYASLTKYIILNSFALPVYTGKITMLF